MHVHSHHVLLNFINCSYKIWQIYNVHELADINTHVFLRNFIKFIINSSLNKSLLHKSSDNIATFTGNWLETWLGTSFITVLYKFDKKWVTNSDVPQPFLWSCLLLIQNFNSFYLHSRQQATRNFKLHPNWSHIFPV